VSTPRPRWLKAFNRGDPRGIEELFDPSMVMHFADSFLPSPPHGLAGLNQVLTLLRTAFPDLTFTLESQAGQGKTHVYNWGATGTHTGPFLRVRATGRRVAFPGRFLMRHDDAGRVVELCARMHLAAVVSQLGMGPKGVG